MGCVMNMKRAALAAVLFVALLAGLAAGPGLAAQETESRDAASFPEADYGLRLEPTLAPGFNFLALLGGSLEPSLGYYGTFWGHRLTAITLVLKGNFGTGAWLRREDGTRIDPLGQEAARATWRQLNAQWTLGASQGLIPNPDPDKLGQDLLSLSLSYAGVYSHKVQSASPDAFVYGSSRPEAAIDVLENQLCLSLDFKDYRTSKLLNTRDGVVGALSLTAAPRGLFNDSLGLADYLKFKVDMRSYVPIVRGRGFSMYLYENFVYDIAWGAWLPMMSSYSVAANANPVRGAVFLRDALSHLSHQLELRMSFPRLMDMGAMPGFSFFYDCGIHDDYDYAFSPDFFAHSVGANFTMHMDSICILPLSAQLDLQFGIAYDIGRQRPSFHFAMYYPNENQL